MGEKDEKKNEGEKKPVAADGGGKKEVEPVTAVLKLDLHCEGCAKKVRRSIRHLEGVEKVKSDCDANKLTVTGNVDPSWLREIVENKTKKKVELVSPQPKKEAAVAAGGGDKKPEEKPEKKADEKKPEEKKPKEPVASTIVMKIRLHCDGCAQKVKKTVLKNINGVQSVTTDLEKDLVTITGTMDVKELTSYIKQKVKRNVDIVPPKKDDGGGGDKKAKEGGGDKQEKQGGEAEKKDKESGGGEKKQDEVKAVASGDAKGVASGEANKGKEEMKVEVINKMEQPSINPHTFYANMPVVYNQNYMNQDYGLPMYQHHHQDHYASTSMGYHPQGPPPPPPTYVNINDQMFSDENPNGCFVM